ncbi:MAG: hypothetical protein QNJ98_13675 [Planctomycetota bacterium]|nr:hypothetical protein [Planctomycetota bacterium]
MNWLFGIAGLMFVTGAGLAIGGETIAAAVVCGCAMFMLIVWLMDESGQDGRPLSRYTNPRKILQRTMDSEDREWHEMRQRRIERRRARAGEVEPPSPPKRKLPPRRRGPYRAPRKGDGRRRP